MEPATRNYDFFLAHAAPDKSTAEALYDLLCSRSEAFLDSRCLQLGDDWDLKLADAQQRSRTTVVLISSRTPRAFYQREEIAAAVALARQTPESHRVVPIYLDDLTPNNESLQPPYGLRVKQGIHLSQVDSLEAVADRLLSLLASSHSTPKSTQSVDTSKATTTQTLPPSPILHGRERELKEIDEALSQLSAAAPGTHVRTPQLLLLAGESGVGKSAIAKFAINLGYESGFEVASAVCEPFHEGMSFFPVREVLRQLVHGGSLFDEVAGSYGPTSSQAQLAKLAERTDADPAQRRDALIATFVNALFSPYRQHLDWHGLKPRLVFIDDLDRIDAGTADALLCFLSRAREGPVLLIGAYRSDLVTSEGHPLLPVLRAIHQDSEVARELSLKPLRRSLLPRATEAILGGPCEFPSRFYERLYRETEGNPLFLREILHSLTRNEGRLKLVDGVWKLASEPETWSIPSTVEEVIEARLDLIDDELRKDLEVASVIGRRFAFEVINRLTESPEDELLQHVEALLDVEIIHELQDSYDSFEFSHGKIRDVLYSSIARIRRRRLHHQVAKVLESAQHTASEDWDALIGQHLYLADEFSAAFPHLQTAARTAMSLKCGFEAAGLYAKAIHCAQKAEMANPKELISLRLEHIEALKLSNDYEATEHSCLDLIRQTQDPLIRGWALNHLGDVYWTLGHSDKALKAYGECETLAREHKDSHLLLETSADLCELHDREAERLAGRDKQRVEEHRALSDQYLDQEVSLAEEFGDAPARTRAWRNRAKQERRAGNLEGALAIYERALALGEQIPTHSVLISYAKTLRFLGRRSDARRAVESVLEWARQTGARRSLAIAYQYRGMLTMEDANSSDPEAKADLTAALDLHTEIGFERGRRETELLLGEWHLLDNDKDAALHHYRRALELDDAPPEQVISIVLKQLSAIGEEARRERVLALTKEAV